MPKDTTSIETNASKVFDLPVKLQPGQVNSMSFPQDSIAEMHLTHGHQLEVMFRDGSKVEIENFQELVNSAQSCGRDTIIQLSDNTIIYPEELNSQLAKGPVSFMEKNAAGNDLVTLNEPNAGQIVEKNIESGHEYKMGFAMDHAASAAQAGQNLIITFKDGGVLVLKNYFTAMNSELPPALTLADGAVVDSTALLTSCKLVETPSYAQTVAGEQQAKAETTTKSSEALAIEPAAGDEAHSEGHAKHAAKKIANVEPAAGNDAVADIEPAAGNAGGLSGGRGGYGFASEPSSVNLNGLRAIGAIGPTALNYKIPDFRNGPIGDNTERDHSPLKLNGGVSVDETGPSHSVSGQINIDFGNDGAAVINPYASTGLFSAAGSLAGGALTSHGAAVAVTELNGVYTGKVGDQVIFTLTLDQQTGAYTFVQYASLDHADQSDANDVIQLYFGVRATDGDGDTANADILVNVIDDAPVAVADGATVGSAPLTVTGNVLTNDHVGFDTTTPAVVDIAFGGTTVAVATAGTTSIAGLHGTLGIAADGSYTYTSNNTALGTDVFTYTMRDGDGDKDYTTLSITVTDLDTVPTITSDEKTVDETDFGTTISVTGSVTADFKGDGPGSIAGSNNFSSDGSKLGGNLTSAGVAVDVAYDAATKTYTGAANGTTVFTLVINNDGSYTYTEFKPLDHANPADPDDTISLHFGVVGVDGDGDEAAGTITINVKDDGPHAVNDVTTIPDGSNSATGNVLDNDTFGADGKGFGVTKVTFDGHTVAVPAAGTVTVAGDHGTLTIDKDGHYTYNSTSEGTDVFTYVIVDKDGDTDTAASTATLTIEVKDIDYTPTITNDVKTVDETDMSPTTSVIGSVTADFKGDGPGTINGNNSFTSDGSRANNALTSHGVAVGVAYDAATHTYTGAANGTPVFTLVINNDGSYTFTQFATLDHADKSNPDDIISLHFGVVGTDTDGDTATGSITINVKDDGPVAHNDVNVYDTHNGGTDGNVITGVNGGPGAADTLSHDTTNTVTKIAFGSTSVDVPAGGTADIDGKYGTLHIKADGSYTYELHANWQSQTGHDFSETLTYPNVAEGVAIPSNSPNLGVDPAAFDISYDTTAKITYVSEAAGYNNTLGVYTIGADGTIQSVQFIVANVNTGAPGTSTTVDVHSTPGQQSLGFFIVADGATANNNYSGVDLANGTLSFVYKEGTADERPAKITDSGEDVSLVYTHNGDGVETILQGAVYHTTERGASTEINADDSVRIVSGLVDGSDHTTLRIGFEDLPGLGDHDYNDVVFDVSIGSTCPTDQFTYTLTDSDGDTSTATLDLNCNGNPDTLPELGSDTKTVDESNFGATISVTGSVSSDFHNDGPGTIKGSNTFTSDGSKLGGNLTSAGVAVGVAYDAATATYTGKANDTVVFTLKINNDGSYTYTEFKPLDHANPADPDDTISLHFGIVGTDSDGDAANGSITINVKDDGPHAVNDVAHIPDGSHTATGNVLDNDTFGADGKGFGVTKVTFGGTTVDVPAVGTVSVTGAHGTLTIDKNGAYTYESTSSGTDQFTYQIVDKDGDTGTAAATATLTVDVTDIDYCPTVTNDVKTVDETNMNPTTSVTGAVVANYFGDGPGKVTVGDSFSSNGSKLGGNLTSGGQTVEVTHTGNVYTGKTPGGETVFTLTVAENGSYTFVLNKPLDHANASDPNDSIGLNFGIVATDADGDTKAGTITINVLDDGPQAVNDTTTVNPTTHIATGNVTTNDNFGKDGHSTQDVTKVIFNGTPHTVPADGSDLTITTSNGTLHINKNGAYTYTATTTNGGVDTFTYVIQDKDHDTDTAATTATLKITVDDIDYCPTITNDTKTVDETNMHPTTSIDGSVTADFKGDGPGTITGTGSFSSDGSRANNALTSGGLAVTVTLAGDTYTGKTSAGDVVFTLKINKDDGSYTFTEVKPLDHADKANPDDIISLHFGVKATDADGDTATGSITINVKDDGPVAHNDVNVYDTHNGGTDGNVITGVNGGPGAADTLSQDVTNKVTKIEFGSHAVTVPATGEATIEGQYGTLKISADGHYTYTLHAGATSGGTTTQALNATQADTAGTQSSISHNGITVTSNNGQDLSWVDEGDGAGIGITGGPVGTDKVYGDGEFLKVSFDAPVNSTTITLADIGSNNVGATYTYNVYVEGSNTPIAKSVVMDAAHISGGLFSFTISSSDVGGAKISHIDLTGSNSSHLLGAVTATTDCGTVCPKDEFTYTLTDSDGDTSKATLDLNCNGNPDTTPTLTGDEKTVDETNLTPVSITGSVTANYLNDGPGKVAGTGVFTHDGSELNGHLTSNGSAITVTLSGGVYTGRTALGETVFTLTVNDNGTYSFSQFKPLDHADGSNPNDSIALHFGVKATDTDGDVATSTITINVKDDAPDAHDDVNNYSGHGGTVVTGNVVTGVNGGANAADILSKDVGNTVTAIKFGNTTVNVPTTGTATIVGDHGTLKIAADGSYTYTVATATHGKATDDFTYTLKDGDGDTDTAHLTLSGDCSPPLTVDLCVNNQQSNVYMKEDQAVLVNITAQAHGTGSEVLSLTITGLKDPNWTFASQAGGTYNSATGTWTITLPKGQDFDGWFRFDPKANSDIDLSNIHVTATATEFGETVSSNGNFNIIVDAVIDTPTLTVQNIPDQSWHKDYTHEVALNIAASVGDKDGSEVITKVVVHLDQMFTNSAGGLTTLDSMGVTLNKGTEVSPGVWEITVNKGDTASALAGLALEVPAGGMDYWPIHQSQVSGVHSLTIPVEAYAQEKNLSGTEFDYTDNNAVVKGSICLNFLITPLALDLNHNGVEVVTQEHGVQFDMNNDGVKDATSWIGKDDGMLALDTNHNGLIDNQSELFGSSTTAENGFAKLSTYDSNGDGIISKADAVFDQLLVWQDANQDGVSQADELHHLADYGIASIKLAALATGYETGDSYVSHESVFTYNDGSEGQIADVWFNVTDGTNDNAQTVSVIESTDHDAAQAAINAFVYSTSQAETAPAAPAADAGTSSAYAAASAPAPADDLHHNTQAA